MGATAEQWFDDDAGLEPVAVRSLTSAGGQGAERGITPSTRWNVLAEELVAFPSRSQRIWLERDDEGVRDRAPDNPRGRAYADAWLDAELASLRDRRRLALEGELYRTSAQRSSSSAAPSSVATLAPTGLMGDPGTSGATVWTRSGQRSSVRSSPARRARAVQATALRPRTRAALIGPRGLRRLLPGAATLAVLVGTWFGVGAMASSAHSVSVVRIPGSVPVHGGLLYVAKPGDTLWSIANRVEPGADPRPLVSELEAQLGGKILLPGDRLVLPR
ncbi:MAG: hypothetical protein ACLPQS_06930 [Acidimicrobiales bacterium]